MSRNRPYLPWMRLAPVPSSTVVLTDSIVDSSALADSSVSTAGIQDSAVTTVKIPDCTITFAKINNITAVRLLGRYDAADGVTQEVTLGANLSFDSDAGTLIGAVSAVVDSSIDSDALADSVVSTQAIQDSAVTTAKLDDAGITTAKFADSAVTGAKIADSTITDSQIIDSAITTAKLNDGGVTTAKYADSSITGAKIADSTITDSQIADSAVTSAKIADSAVTSTEIADGTIVAADFSDTTLPHRLIQVVVTDTTLVTGDGQGVFNIPLEMDSWDLIDADVCLDTNTSATVGPTFQIRNETQGADMLSTKITVDTSEVNSFTAATAPVIDSNNDSVVVGDRIEVDVDSAGTASGLRVLLTFKKF